MEDTQDNRPIENLLKEDTFQGMSDAEIMTLINYSSQRAATDAVHAYKMATQEEMAQRERDAWEALKKTGDRLMDSIMNTPLSLEVVEDA